VSAIFIHKKYFAMDFKPGYWIEVVVDEQINFLGVQTNGQSYLTEN